MTTINDKGTKDASVDVQMAAEVKAGHKILAVDPITGMFVGMTPEQLAAAGGGVGGPVIIKRNSIEI